MKRGWLVLALLLSLGVNAGILATLAVSRRTAPPPATVERPPAPAVEAIEPAPGGAGRARETPSSGPAAAREETVAEEAGGTPEEPQEARREPSEPRPPAASPARPPAAPERAEPPASPAGPPPAEGAPPEREGVAPPNLEPRLQRLADELGLGGERRVRFLVLQRRMIVAVVTAERRRRLLAAELRRQLVAPAPDEARIGELIRRQADLVVEMERTTARTILASRRLLDPDQERRYLAVVSRLRPRLREEAIRRGQEGSRAGAETRPRRPFRRPR